MNKTVKNSAIYFLGTIIMGMLGFVNTMLLTRILPQQTYAMYGLLTTFTTAVISFVSLGYDTAYMRFYYNHGLSQKRYIFNCMKAPFLMFAVFLVLIFEPTQTIIKYLFDTKLSVLALLALTGYIFFSFIHKFTQITARMEERATNYILSNIVNRSGFILILGVAYCIVSELSFNWVLLSFMVAGFFSVFINLLIFKKIIDKKVQKGEEVTQKELFSYGFPYMINNFLLLGIPVVEKLIIRDLAGWEVLSIYTAAAVFQTVVLLLQNTLTNIWNPIVFKNCDKEAVFKPLLHNFGMASTMIVTLGLAACVLLRRWLVLLLDNSYFSVYIIAPAVCFCACFNVIALIYSVGINIKKKTMHLVIAPIIQLTISVGMCYLLVPQMGLKGVAIAMLVSIVISKFYRIAVGLLLYDTGVFEIKSLLVCIMDIVASLISLFSTALLSDIFVSVLLVVLMLVIFNKDILPLVKLILNLVKPKKVIQK